MPNSDRTLAVEVRELTKRFGPVLAVDRANMAVRSGTIHALVGENGAGKSTLLATLFGLVTPDAGEIVVDGVAGTIARPRDAIARGLGMVHQHFSLVPALTVAENVVLGAEPRRGLALDRGAAADVVDTLGSRFGLRLDPKARVVDLSLGACQWVELLKALHRGARILLLDEPTAVLTPLEVERLLDALRALRADGRTVVFVTHKLSEVTACADDVTVMRGGRVALAATMDETSEEAISFAMIGRPPAAAAAPSLAPADAREVLAVRDLVVTDRGRTVVDGVSLSVRSGEIVGVAGVEGNGQSEMLEAIAGLRLPASGSIVVASRDGGARAASLGFVPADRHAVGLVLAMDLAENAVLGEQDEPAYFGGGIARIGAIAAHAAGLVKAFDVRPTRLAARASALSGGNQQKLVVARELAGDPGLVLAAQPTRGVDVGAIEVIHGALRAARDRGAAVLLVSSELDELFALSDRIVVMFRGRLTGAVDPRSADAADVGRLMTGGEAAAPADGGDESSRDAARGDAREGPTAPGAEPDAPEAER